MGYEINVYCSDLGMAKSISVLVVPSIGWVLHIDEYCFIVDSIHYYHEVEGIELSCSSSSSIENQGEALIAKLQSKGWTYDG